MTRYDKFDHFDNMASLTSLTSMASMGMDGYETEDEAIGIDRIPPPAPRKIAQFSKVSHHLADIYPSPYSPKAKRKLDFESVVQQPASMRRLSTIRGVAKFAWAHDNWDFFGIITPDSERQKAIDREWEGVDGKTKEKWLQFVRSNTHL